MMMLWFSLETPPGRRFVGLHCGLQGGAYVVTLVSPDGSQEVREFDDEDAMFEAAMRIHSALAGRGWRVCPEPQLDARPA